MMVSRPQGLSPQHFSTRRFKIWYALLVFVCAIFIVRLFYLQVIRHDYYQKAALQGQLKEYEIPASRGIIEIHDGERTLPLVLNEKRYTAFADPKFIKDARAVAERLQPILGGKTEDYETKMRAPGRYSILAKKLTKEQKEKIDQLDIKGLGTREAEYRTYPEGSLAAQLLGFVNDEGEGKYGVEQALDKELRGTSGRLHAITDAQGVPLVSHKDNVVINPNPGRRVVLTIDLTIQRQAEDILKAGLEAAKSGSGSVVILEAGSGAVKAMANLPTYNPAEFSKVEDASLFTNAVVSAPFEIGSVMKPLTIAAGLDKGVITPETSYFDPGFFRIDEATITNVAEVSGSGTRSIKDILQMSLNTGAVFVLRQMGGGEINEQARLTWHDYLSNHYRFGRLTGIEQGYESEGFVPSPTEGFGLGIQYANTAFGQGLNITALQLASALGSVVNGGTYYRPRLIDQYVDQAGNARKVEPEVVRAQVISEQVSATMREFMRYIVDKNNRPAVREGYMVGGKTGTAQVGKPGGGYYDDRYNGSYIGFVGQNRAQYVIVVRVNEPGIRGYAGSQAAGPIFANLTNMLIDNFKVTP